MKTLEEIKQEYDNFIKEVERDFLRRTPLDTMLTPTQRKKGMQLIDEYIKAVKAI